MERVAYPGELSPIGQPALSQSLIASYAHEVGAWSDTDLIKAQADALTSSLLDLDNSDDAAAFLAALGAEVGRRNLHTEVSNLIDCWVAMDDADMPVVCARHDDTFSF